MKHFSRSLIWLTVSEIIFTIAGYIIHSALGRILAPSDYGRYSLVITLTTMIIVLIGNGIPTAMAKYLSEIIDKDPRHIQPIKRKTIRMQAVLMLSVTVVFFLAAPLIAHLLGDPTLTPLFRFSALIIPAFAAASFYFSFFTGLHFFRLQATLKTVRALGRVIFIITLAYFFGVPGAVGGYIAAPLLVFAVAIAFDFFYTKKIYPAVRAEKPIALSPTFSTRAIIAFAWPLTLFLLFYQLISSVDLYLVKALLHDDYLTGLYNAVITSGGIPYFLFYALTIILLPAISKTTAERNTAETTHLLTKSLRLMVFVLVPLVTLLALYSTQTLHLIYGSAYTAAADPMRIYTIGIGMLTVFYVLSFALNGAGFVKVPMRIAFVGLVINSVINIFLIPHYALTGAAIAEFITGFFLMLAALWSIYRHFAVHIPSRLWWASALGAVVMLLVARILPDHALWFVFSSTALTALYFLVLRFCGALTPADIRTFLPFTKSRTP